ncbi:DUF2690 domain-containing protein [Couchioplanes caeruleus]|nr:DUF2690 domain-containing protein [Couchioplanes caeruleus]ROP33923.1 uncharacterized protein DUF2690 [Couchioplanes caeruleus]
MFRTRVRRWCAYLALAAVAAVMAPAVAAQPALAQCWGCDGVDPNTNGCTRPTSPRHFTTSKTNLYIELRFSGDCGGVWTRSTQPGNDRYGTDIFLESNDGMRYKHRLGHSSQEWTPMMRWTRTVRACYGWGYEGPDWSDYDVFECTSWW